MKRQSKLKFDIMIALKNNFVRTTELVDPGGVSLVLQLLRPIRSFFSSNIRVKILEMHPPTKTPSGDYQRNLKVESPINIRLLLGEREVRRIAYENTELPGDPSFFTDEDMEGDYNLICVYDEATLEVYLSARYYYNKPSILKELVGDTEHLNIFDQGATQLTSWAQHEMDNYEEGEVFLIDRMSGHIGHRQWNERAYFKLKLYRKLFNANFRAKKFYALARRSKKERLLTEYLSLGLRIRDRAFYHGVEHWVLVGNWQDMMSQYGRNKQYLGIMRNTLRMRGFKRGFIL